MLTLDHSKHFFSQLARVLGAKLPGSGTAASFLATIKSWEKKGEFAKEELASSELLPWLSSLDSQTHLSKEEVVSRAQEQLPPLGFLLNGPPPGGALAQESYSVEQDSTSGKCLLVDDYGVEVESFDSEADAREFAHGSSTRYATHSTTGGEHYRELLITLPKNEAAGPDERGANYFSGHWTGIANVVAHVRFDERLSLEGRRVLFCQEFQSDWHQEGRRRGYCDDPPLAEEQQSRLDILLSAKEQAGGIALSPQEEQDLAALSMLREQKAVELSRNGVAGGPYKKSWPLVAFKEALLWAALYGFDALAWTKGEEHIKRYSHLRKNADTIQWIKLSENNYLVNAFEHGRDVVVRSGMTVSDLVDALGETAATKIASSPFSDGEITGAKLRVDDKGMYGFYDHIMPKIVDKYLKRWKTKTNEIDILKDTKNHWYIVPSSEFHKGRVPAGEKEWVVASANGRRDHSFHEEEDALDRADFLNDTFAAHGFYLSEDMRNSLVTGQPLFSASEIEESAPAEVEITRERDSVERAYYGYSDGRSKGLRVWISPDDFLALAPPSLEGTVEARAGRMGAFDNEKFNGTDYLPHLQIERDGQVVDHEGRARALVAKRSGVAKIPVTISMYRPVADVDGFPKKLTPQQGGQPVEIKGGRLVSKLSAPASERAPGSPMENSAIPVKESPEASAIAAAITKTMVGGAAIRFEYIQFNRAFFTPFGGAWTDRESTFGVAELTEKEVLAALHDKAQAYKIEKEEYYADPDTGRRSELSEEAGVESGRTGVAGVEASDANRNRSHEDQDGQRDVREDQAREIVGSTITDPAQMVEPVTDMEKKYLGRNLSIGHLTNRQAITELLLSGVTPEAREKLKERLHDHVLGEYGAVKFADIDETITDLHNAGIPYVYGRVDGGNLGGLNDHHGNHYDADADIKEIWGKEYVAAVRKYGAVIGRDQGDEFKEIWPNYSRAEVVEIRADIEKNIRAKVDERGLTDVFHPKIKMPTGALYTAYGYVDAATTPEGTPAFRDMDREADFIQKEMKITYEIEQAIARGYVQLEGTKEYRQKEEGDELTELQQETWIAEGRGEQRGPGVYYQDEHKPGDGDQGQGNIEAVGENHSSAQANREPKNGGLIRADNTPVQFAPVAYTSVEVKIVHGEWTLAVGPPGTEKKEYLAETENGTRLGRLLVYREANGQGFDISDIGVVDAAQRRGIATTLVDAAFADTGSAKFTVSTGMTGDGLKFFGSYGVEMENGVRVVVNRSAVDSGEDDKAPATIIGEKPTQEPIDAVMSPATISDFGEKIGGARKDYATKMAEAKKENIAVAPLSKSWPLPNYENMLKNGADPYVVGFARAAREEIPSKPQGWRVGSWAENVESLRDFTEKLVSGEFEKEKLLAAMPPSLRDSVGFRAEMYAKLGHKTALAGIKVGFTHYNLYHDQKNVSLWEVTKPRKATAFSNMPETLAKGGTREEAIANFISVYESLDASPAARGRQTKFEIYRYRGKTGAWIGKKVGKDYVDLKRFDDTIAAREYLRGNQETLESLLEKAKYVPNERRDANRERVGPERASGNVTPEMFTEAFGFRGVEFGNWVSDKGERQQHLNMAYDSFADLADVLGIPTQAISLNGELGLAFGARGKGGAHAAAAHYEPDRVVINLTRKQGAGSLGHEWFHGADNYFSRQRGDLSGFISDKPYQGLSDSTRPEVLHAFKSVSEAIAKTELKKRSLQLDKKRSTPYWSTGIEMAARSFENYIIDRLAEQGFTNDYLANIKGEHEFLKDLATILFTGDGTETAADLYPYLTDNEKPGVSEAFRNLFATLKTKQTIKGVALYEKGVDYERRIEKLTPEQQENTDSAARDAVAYLRGLPGTLLGNRIAKSFQDHSKTEILGQQIESVDDLAIVGQIFRNPSFETNRYIFVRDGVVVHTTGVTSRLPGSCAAFAGRELSLADGIKQLNAMLEKSGADGFYMLHNHPGGNPKPSDNDIQLTQTIGLSFVGIFKGHVIINHDSYATIVGFDVQEKPLPKSSDRYGHNEPSLPHPLLGAKIISADMLAEAAARLEREKDTFQLVSIAGSNGEVGGIMDVPISSVRGRNPLRLTAMVRKFSRATGSSMVFAVNVPESTGINFEAAIRSNILHDVHMQGGGSLANNGINPEDGMEAGRKVGVGFSVREPNDRTVFSKLEQVAKTNFLGMKAQGVMGFLGKHGVKKTEMEAVGLVEWLSAKKPTDKVTQAELVGFVRANTLELEDVVLGENELGDKAIEQRFKAVGLSIEKEMGGDVIVVDSEGDIVEPENLEKDHPDLYRLAIEYEGRNSDNVMREPTATHFSQYTEPGAVEGSYRELFVTAPSIKDDGFTITWNTGEKEKFDSRANLQEEVARKYGMISDWAVENYIDKNLVNRTWQDGHSQYSDVKNPVVRIRFNEVNADGKRLLRIEEMQGPTPDNQAKMPKHLRENIYQLGMKRILAYAKENGFDGVALATKPGMTAGETQVDRYSLENQVDSIDVIHNGYPGAEGTYDINGEKDGSMVVSKTGITRDKLAGVIGKDLAARAVKEIAPGLSSTYSGLDLRVGGDGLKQLYDTTLPAMLEAYGKGKMMDISVIDFTGGGLDADQAAYLGWEPKTYSQPYLPLTNAPGSYPLYSGDSTITKSSLTSANSIQTTYNALAKFWNQATIDSLVNTGILRIVQDQSELPGGSYRPSAMAWHGSPHQFNQFNLDAIGRGEGNQAFGWGLYFSAEKRVAEWYADHLTEEFKDISIGKFTEDDLLVVGGGSLFKDAAAQMAKRLDRATTPEQKQRHVDEFKALIKVGIKTATDEIRKLEEAPGKWHNPYLFTTPADQMEALEEELSRLSAIHDAVTPDNVKKTSAKNIYRVALNPGKQHDRWLDWFEAINPVDRRRIIDHLKTEGLDDTELTKEFEAEPRTTGIALYYGLSEQFGSKKDASLFLSRAGFDGVRYPAEGNRSTGIHNYVVFDDRAVEVREHTVRHSRKGLRIRGAYYEDLHRSYLVASHLTPETAPGVLLHEVGVHTGLQGMLGEKLYNECIDQARGMLEEKDPEMLHAWARIPSVSAGKPKKIDQAHLSPTHIIEEAIGYYVERPENHNTSLAKKIFSGIRTWAFRMGLPVRLKKEDLVSLAKAGVIAVARNPQRFKDAAKGAAAQAPTERRRVAPQLSPQADISFSVEQASPFYSQLENHLVANLPEQTSPAQLRQLLASWSQEGRFSKEELEWSGLVGWINEKEEKSTPVLSRDSVLGQLAAQRVMVSSVVKDEPTPVPPLLWQSHELATSAEAMDFIPFIHRSSVVLGMWQDLRYGYKVAHTDRGFILLNDQLDEIKSSGAGQNEHGYFTTFEDAQEAATSDLADRIDVVVAWSRRPEYKAGVEGYHKISLSIPHGAENIPLATARFGDRTMDDGRRTLFIRELEGQGGASSLNGADGMLAMKRMILWAAENDYQAIAWPTAAKSSDSILYGEGLSEDVSSYIHQWGSELSSSKLAEQGARPEEVHVFGVTSAMRDAAFAGQPLFSAEETRQEPKEPKGNSMSAKSQDRQEAVQRIKDAVDIVEIIGEHVKLTRAGANYKGLCPFHTEKTPSFTVNPERKTFRCFGCGEGGDAFDFMMRYHGMTFPEAVKELAARYNIPLPDVSHSPEELAKAKQRESLYLANEKASVLFQGLLDDAQQGEAARQYLAEREIPAEIISRFRIGFAPDRWDFLTTALAKEKISSETGKEAGLLAPREKSGGFYDRFRNRVVFPILNLTGKVVGFGGRILGEGDPKYLNTPETPIFDKGKNLFGLYQNREAIRQARQGLIVEGNFDMISLVVHGVENVVAPLGTALTSSQIRTLRGYCDEACLIFDGDAAGVKAAMRAVPIFLAEQLPAKVVVLPDGHDPDTFIRAQGKDALLELVSQAKPLSEFLFDELVRQHGATIEGKSRVVSELRTIIDGLDDRDLQRTLFGVHFAEKLGIPPEQLLASLGGSKKPAAEAGEIPQAVARMAGQGESIAWPDLSRFGVRLGYSGADRRSACLALQVLDLEKMMTSVSDHSHIIFQEGLGIDPLRLSAAERGDVFLSSAKSASARLLKDLFPDFNLESDIRTTLKSALFLPLDYWRQAPLTEYINEVYRLAAETGGDPLLSPDSFSQVLAAREGGVSPSQCAALYFTTGKGVVATLGDTPIAAAEDILPMETLEPVTKEKVFPPLKSAGVEPAAAMVIKILRERLPVDSTKNMVTIDAKSGAQAHSPRVYTMVLGNIHDELKKVKTTEDLRGAMERLRSKIRPAFGTDSKNSSPQELLFAQQFLESVGQKALGIVRDYEIILSWAEDRVKSQAEPKPTTNKMAKKPAAATPGRPVPKKIIRHGSDVRSGEAITLQRLMDDFGFSAVKFDSLMKGPERQALLNHAYEAFSDLAETTGLDRRAMSLQGSHSLLFSGKAIHYAVHEAVLHLPIATKGGGLAHQWAHAFQAVVAQSGKSSVFSGVNETMTRTIIKAGERRVVLEQDVKRLGEWSQALINYFGKRLPEDSKGVFAQKARRQLVAVAKLETTPQLAMNDISRLYSEFSPRAFNKKESDRLFGNIFWLHKASTELRTVSALRPDLGYEHKDTQYFYNAKLLDKSRKQDLWASQPELFARAFEAFISDRMSEQQWRSDYLVYGVEAERFADPAILGANPYPTGAERGAINQAIAGAVIAASHLCFHQQSTQPSSNNMEKQSEEMSDAPKVRAAGM